MSHAASPQPIQNDRTLKSLTAACNRLTVILIAAVLMGGTAFVEMQLDRIQRWQYLHQRVSELQKSNAAKASELAKREAEDQIAYEKSKAVLERWTK